MMTYPQGPIGFDNVCGDCHKPGVITAFASPKIDIDIAAAEAKLTLLKSKLNDMNTVASVSTERDVAR